MIANKETTQVEILPMGQGLSGRRPWEVNKADWVSWGETRLTKTTYTVVLHFPRIALLIVVGIATTQNILRQSLLVLIAEKLTI